MAKYDLEHLAGTYAVADRFVTQALRRDGSLFTPGRAIWTEQGFRELSEHFVEVRDANARSFDEKLRVQLSGCSSEAIQLMAELLYIYYLPTRRNILGHTKREKIQEVLSAAARPSPLPEDLAAALDHGIGGAGVAFIILKHEGLRYLIDFFLSWKRSAPEQRERALADPWSFKEVADRTPVKGGTYAREALLHLVHPDHFERIFAQNDKQQLTRRLSMLAAGETDDLDRRIAQIRSRLEQRFGPGLDFYDTVPVMAMWKPQHDRWAAFLYWAIRFREHPSFDAEERTYKIQVAQRIAAARQAHGEGRADWLERLAKALRSRENNLTNWRQHDPFLKWAIAEPEVARETLSAIWAGGADPVEALSRFLERLPRSALGSPGARIAVGSLLLMATDPFSLPPYRSTPLHRAYKLVGFGEAANQEVDRYRQALSFFDEVHERAAQAGFELRDRLDAQGVTFCITSDWVPENWPEEDRVTVDAYRETMAGRSPSEPPEPTEPLPASARPEPPESALAKLADKLLIDEEELAEIAGLLEIKRQVVFYGPPGTGKTFVAMRLAETLAGSSEHVRLVQFHPSYAYEDFVEGFRPRLHGGQAGFELVHGALRRIAEQAAADREHHHFLIIDELNRGNVAKIFGELYFLLEYRDQPIELQYSAASFTLPENLRILGTMNTADRSIALLDAALRRRFAFVPFFPNQRPIAGLLDRWLARHRPEMRWLARVVDRANELLRDRNGAIGPSFFLDPDLDDARAHLIWRHQILPYIEDRYFDQPERLAEFDLEKLRSAADSLRGDETASGPDADRAD